MTRAPSKILLEAWINPLLDRSMDGLVEIDTQKSEVPGQPA
jgi:hypothetical protein